MRPKLSLSCLLGFIAFAVVARAQAPKAPAEPMIGDIPLGEAASSTLQASNRNPFVGEVFTVTHQVSVLRRAYQSLGDAWEWNAPGLNVEDWTNPVQSESRANGEMRVVLTQTARAYAREAGALSIPSAMQSVVLVTGTTRTDLTTQTNTEKHNLRTFAPKLQFKPLPGPTPVTFMGAVGEFNFVSRVSSAKVAVGESVTWTLELSGAGNWPELRGLPGRSVSRDFTVVKPVINLALKTGTLFEGTLTEDVLLVPTKNGTYQLGPMRYTYFDPKSGKYQMITTETIMLTVGTGGPLNTTGGTTPTTEESSAPGSSKTVAGVRIPVPESPPPLPLQPMGGVGSGFAPLAWSLLKGIAIAPFVLALLYWLKLAADHRRLTDPHRKRREAREGIAEALAKLDPPDRTVPPAATIREQVYRWQQATTRYWQIGRPVPKPGELARAIERLDSPAAAATWMELWRESEATLHGKLSAFAGGWVKRAEKALHASPLADPPIAAIFLPRNLLPFASVILLALLPLSLHADAASDAYLKGDFAAAEKLWLETVHKSPRDPIARYNLSLAQSQQDRWGEAATQALAAFCLAPGNDAIRWQFRLALNRSGIDHPLITSLANRESFFKVVGLLSPGAWGLVLDIGAFVFAIAVGVFLWTLYYRVSGPRRTVAGIVALVALVLVVSAALSVKRYGLLADRSIAVVAQSTQLRSVPTEVASSQKTSPLPAGSLGAVDKVFLGWSRLVFPNGQTGWVQTSLVTHLYQ